MVIGGLHCAIFLGREETDCLTNELKINKKNLGRKEETEVVRSRGSRKEINIESQVIERGITRNKWTKENASLPNDIQSTEEKKKKNRKKLKR